MNKSVIEELKDFVRNELDDGVTFEDLLEEFDLTPEEVFVFLFKNGLIDEDVLDTYIRDGLDTYNFDADE